MLLVSINDDRPTYNLHLLYMYSMFFSMGVAELLVVVLHLYCPNGISPMGNLGCFAQGKPAATDATKPTVHAGCLSVSITHQTLTWITGSLTCAQILMHAIAYEGVQTP